MQSLKNTNRNHENSPSKSRTGTSELRNSKDNEDNLKLQNLHQPTPANLNETETTMLPPVTVAAKVSSSGRQRRRGKKVKNLTNHPTGKETRIVSTVEGKKKGRKVKYLIFDI